MANENGMRQTNLVFRCFNDMNPKIFWPLANTLGFAVVIAVNALANILPINGLNTGQVSALYPSLFTPAGITFSIWSIIYLLLLAFTIIQWGTLRHQLWFPKLSRWFLISCVANASWILVWHYLMPGLSLVVMLILWYSLSQIFLLLRTAIEINLVLQRFLQATFSVYFAWICVATIANTSCLLVFWNWSGAPLTATVWVVVMMVIATVLAVYMAQRFGALSFSLVVAWALLGIYLRWKSSTEEVIWLAAIVLIIGLMSHAVYKIYKMRGVTAV